MDKAPTVCPQCGTAIAAPQLLSIRHVDGRWRTIDSIGMPEFTEDPNRALVFLQRDLADAFACDDPEDVRIVEFDAESLGPGTYPADDDRWLLHFEDQDRRDEHFTSEAAAIHRLNQAAMSWHCHLYKRVATTARDTIEPKHG